MQWSPARKVLTELEQACEEHSAKSKGGLLKCERVTLYQGGQYWIYKYKRYEDVRLVFVPDRDIAAFGGDPDNFQFPRWCLDMSILRAYEDGKPAQTRNRLRFDWDGADPGDPVFVSGAQGPGGARLRDPQLVELDDRLVDASGGSARGFLLDEDRHTIQILDLDGFLRSFSREKLSSVETSRESIMPSYADVFGEGELNDLISFLSTRRSGVSR
jgi:hypothetical protein